MSEMRIASVVFMVMVGLSWVARAEEPAAAAAQSSQEKALAAKMARQVPEIRFSGQGLEDVVDFMRDVSGVNLFVNWRALEAAGIKRNAPVTLQVKNLTLRAALVSIVEAVGTDKAKATLASEDGVAVISAEADPKNPPARVTVAAIPAGVDRKIPEVRLNGQELADVMDFLRDVTEMDLRVDWKKLEAKGVKRGSPVTVQLKDVPASTVIRFVLESVSDGKTPLEVTWANNAATVTTGTAKAAGEGAGRR